MNKKVLPIVLFCLLSMVLIPVLAHATQLVNCGNDGPTGCKLSDLTNVGKAIYKLILEVAIPIAVAAVTIGGVLMMISAGDPGRFGLGKKIFWSAIIGLVLVLAAEALINFFLSAIGSTITV